MAHSEDCRKRMEKQLEGTDRMEKAKREQNEFFEEVLKCEEKRRRDGAKDGDDKGVKDNDAGMDGDAQQGPQSGAQQPGEPSGIDEEVRKRELEETRGAEEAKSRRTQP